jgi:hypothetical protein
MPLTPKAFCHSLLDMKNAILECLFLLIVQLATASVLFFIECPAWLQWSFFAMAVLPTFWFIPKRIWIETKYFLAE